MDEGTLGGHMGCGQGRALSKGHVPEKAPAKRENLPECVCVLGGPGAEIQKPLCPR